jgi:hypothetical protein
MSRQTSFAYQRNVLERFSSRLKEFVEEMKNLNEKYNADIFSLYEEEGLIEEIYMDYKVYMNALEKEVNLITMKITEEHIPFVDKEIDFLSSRP